MKGGFWYLQFNCGFARPAVVLLRPPVGSPADSPPLIGRTGWKPPRMALGRQVHGRAAARCGSVFFVSWRTLPQSFPRDAVAHHRQAWCAAVPARQRTPARCGGGGRRTDTLDAGLPAPRLDPPPHRAGAIYPNDTVVFEHGDAASSRFAAPSYARGAYDHAYAAEQAAAPAFGDGTRPPLSPWQLAHSIERELAKPMAAAPSPPPAPVATKGPADDEAADRKRWLEILDLYHAAKEGRIAVDNTRGIGIVPPEQPFRRARSG